MRITKVSYGELRSGPGFTNQRVEMEAEVYEHESPQGVMGNLRDCVRAELQVGEPVNLEHEKRLIAEQIVAAMQLPTRECVTELNRLADSLGYMPF